MIQLLGGPASGNYQVKRAPLYLRGVVDAKGKKDVLDQLTDSPALAEKVYVYHRKTDAFPVHLNFGRRGAGFFMSATYEYLEAVNGEELRETAAWRDWCYKQLNQEKSVGTKEVP